MSKVAMTGWILIDVAGLFFLFAVLAYFTTQVLVCDLPKAALGKVRLHGH